MKSIEIGYQHDAIQQYKNIKKGTKEDPYRFVTEGLWAYEKLITADIIIESIFICHSNIENQNQKNMILQLEKKAFNVFSVSDKTMGRIHEKKVVCPVVMICSLKVALKPFSRVVILDGLESPGNIGTIFRTCDAAGIEAVFIVNQKTTVNQYKTIKASMGGMFHVPWFHFSDVKTCKSWLEENEFITLLAHPPKENDKYLYNAPHHKPLALVMGNERYGLSDDWFDGVYNTVSIPMNGCCDSLNVAVAASILIYQKMMGPT